VKIPNVAEQWRKTPIKRRIIEEYEDPVTGGIVKVPRWIWWVEGSGETAEVLKLDSVRDRLLLASEHSKAEMKRVLRQAGGRPKKDSKKGVLAGFIELYIREVKDEEYAEKTSSEFEREIDDWFVREGRWGLGCPHNCGRFWEFKPTKDLSFFQPVDKLASTPFVDDEGISHNGYLEWRWKYDETGNLVGASFICDRCGKEVELER